MTQRIVLAIAALALYATPAAAQALDWSVANEAYAAGKAKGREARADGPMSLNDRMMCGAAWAKWNSYLNNDKVPQSARQGLDAEIVDYALTYTMVLARVASTDQAKFTALADQAAGVLDAIIAGNSAAMPRYFGLLGRCVSHLDLSA